MLKECEGKAALLQAAHTKKNTVFRFTRSIFKTDRNAKNNFSQKNEKCISSGTSHFLIYKEKHLILLLENGLLFKCSYIFSFEFLQRQEPGYSKTFFFTWKDTI